MFSIGVKYMLISALFFSFMNVSVKWLAHIPAVEIILFRSIVSLIMCYFLLRKA